MAGKIEYRYLAAAQDFAQLLPLYKQLLGRQIELDELQWRFTQNPTLNDFFYNYAALNSDRMIAGHTAYIPMHFIINGNLLKGALAAGSMVSPQNPALFPKLHSDLEKKMIADGFDFLFAFPNENSFPFFVKYFGFKEHPLDYLSLDIRNLQPSDNCVPIPGITRGITNRLSSEFLQWRIFSSPLHTYRIYEDPDIRLIYKKYGENQTDIICIQFKNAEFRLSSLYSFLSTLDKAEQINLYSTSKKFTDTLTTLGFAPAPADNRLVYKILSDNVAEEGLFLQMIDSDLF